jgi:transcriptional regulator with XRE-family HTH domain
MSGRQAAFALGWKQPYISRRLSGVIPFDVNDLAALARLLGIPVTAFFEGPPRVGARAAQGLNKLGK